MAASWSDVLDLYGRALLDFERQLEEGRAATAEFSFRLPNDLGPLPPDLADVAKNVAELSARVESRVGAAMVETAHAQAAVTRARRFGTRERRPPKFVDVNG